AGAEEGCTPVARHRAVRRRTGCLGKALPLGTVLSLRLVLGADLDADGEWSALYIAHGREARSSRAGEVDGDSGIAHAQALEGEPLQARRQMGIDDLQPPAGRVGIEPEAAAEHEEERAGGPRLRRAGDRIAHDQVALAAAHAAIQLGGAVMAELE